MKSTAFLKSRVGVLLINIAPLLKSSVISGYDLLSNAKKTHKNFTNQSLKSRFRYLRNRRVENKTKEDKWEN
jgi:hypothetical protein